MAVHPAILLGGFANLLKGIFIDRRFMPALPQLRKIEIAKDREQPGPQIGAFLKAIEVLPRFENGLLHQVISEVCVSTERDGEGSEPREMGDQIMLDGLGTHRYPTLSVGKAQRDSNIH